MNELYLLLTSLTLITCIAVLLPWMRKKHALQIDESRVKTLYAEKLADLKDDLTQGKIESDAYEAAKDDLTIQLAAELSGNKQHRTSKIHRQSLWLLPVFTLLISFLIYGWQGKPEQMQNWYQAKEKTPDLGKKLISGNENFSQEELQQFYLGLRTQLATKPDDATGWLLLGRVAYSAGILGEAIEAFERSLKIDANQYPAQMSLAQTLISVGDEKSLKRASRIYNQLLQNNPQNAEALTMAGYVALQLGNRQTAQEYWKYALRYLPETDQRRNAILQTLPELANAPNVTQNKETVSEKTTSVGKQIELTIELTQSTQRIIDEFKFLVVFARPQLSGPPAAVVRLPIVNGQIPTKVTLSDQHAMMDGFNLSSLSSAFVTVRLSKDADVMMSKDEIEQHSEELTLADSTSLKLML
ncbi:c-type cytochrome biogenesis protein CcmI [Catenovulum sediminis]|uniref:C-type cytochrome biogenesis protein CcmI n=1 Tax=Catenovulum sediminis TaxID=1740262 RepID=A0ABV1RKL4_9ALTE